MTTQPFKLSRTYPTHQFQNWISQTAELIDTIPQFDDVQFWGATGNGVTNDTAAIQRAIDANLGNLYFPPGVYIHGFLRVRSNTVWQGQGTLQMLTGLVTTSSTVAIYGENSNNVFPVVVTGNLSNLKFIGLTFTAPVNQNFQIGFWNPVNVEFTQCTFLYTSSVAPYLDTVFLAGTWTGTGVNVPFGPGPNYYNNPVANTYGSNVRFHDNYCSGMQLHTPAINGLVVSDNIFLNGHWPLSLDVYTTDATVTGNVFRKTDPRWTYKDTIITTGFGMYIGQASERVTVTGNEFFNCGSEAISMESCRAVTISGNHIRWTDQSPNLPGLGLRILCSELYAVVLGSSEITIASNTFTGVEDCFDVGSATLGRIGRRLQISSNNCEGIAQANCIFATIRQMDDVVILDNQAEGFETGVNLASQTSNRVKVSGNKFYLFNGGAVARAVFYGIFCSDVVVQDNDCYGITGGGGRHVEITATTTNRPIAFRPGKSSNITAWTTCSAGATSIDIAGTDTNMIYETVSTSTACDIMRNVSFIDTTAGALAITLGGTNLITYNGLAHHFVHTAGTNSAVFTIANGNLDGAGNGAIIVTNNISETFTLKWLNGAWRNVCQSPGVTVGSAFVLLTVNSATPSIAASKFYRTLNTAPTTITNFLGGVSGDVVYIKIGDANTTFDFTANANMVANSAGTDWAAASGDMLIAVNNGTLWTCEIISQAHNAIAV